MSWLTVAIVLVVLLLLLVGAVVAILLFLNNQAKQHDAKIERQGDLTLCWIVNADETLYEASKAPGFANARVVFTTKDHPDLHKRLKEAARRLKKGEIVDEEVDVEKIEDFYEKYKNLRWFDAPLRLPKWLVGDFKVYTSLVQVYWKKLPGRRLKESYIYCYVLLGEGGGAVMTEYPDEEDED